MRFIRPRQVLKMIRVSPTTLWRTIRGAAAPLNRTLHTDGRLCARVRVFSHWNASYRASRLKRYSRERHDLKKPSVSCSLLWRRDSRVGALLAPGTRTITPVASVEHLPKAATAPEHSPRAKCFRRPRCRSGVTG
jgi:hypothetical protein